MSLPFQNPQIPTLYDYQDEMLTELRGNIQKNIIRQILHSPTGSGKGTTLTWMAWSAANKPQKYRTLFLVNRRELVKDLSRRLDRYGLDHGVIMAQHWRYRPDLPVQVASIDTLHRRPKMPKADLIIADECRFSTAPSWRKVLDRYPDTPLIGADATPIGASGRGLGELYQRIVHGPSVAELTERGFLVPARMFAPSAPDVRGVEVSNNGEYNQKQLATACDKASLTGDIVSHWTRLGAGRPSIAFAVNKAHSRHIVEQFCSATVSGPAYSGPKWKWIHVDDETPDAERDSYWRQLAGGQIDGVSNVGIISYGWDVPIVSCAILARPWRIVSGYLQQCGRVLRTAPGKQDAIVLDHAGCCLAHGFPDDDREWSLEGVKKRAKSDRDPALAVRTCPACWAAFPSRLQICPHCSAEYPVKATQPEVVDGELTEVTAAHRKVYTIRKLSSDPEVAALQQIAQERQFRPGWFWRQLAELKQKRAEAEIATPAPRRIERDSAGFGGIR